MLSENYTLPAEPNLTFNDILRWLYGEPEFIFTARELSGVFSITPNDMRVRCHYLRRWRLIEQVNRRMPYKYRISEKGIMYVFDKLLSEEERSQDEEKK